MQVEYYQEDVQEKTKEEWDEITMVKFQKDYQLYKELCERIFQKDHPLRDYSIEPLIRICMHWTKQWSFWKENRRLKNIQEEFQRVLNIFGEIE